MRKNHKLIWTIVSMFVFFCIHVSLLSAENGSPVKIVENFAKAYFMLDNSMAEHLSKDALVNSQSVNMVDLYLEKKSMEADNCGYKITFLQKKATNMKIKVLNMGDSRATIEFDAITIRSLNPVYRVIGSVLGLVEKYKVHDIITVIKENGEWKIGPGAFEMPI